ncbi:hypothetical protein Cpir12675_003743 [Ceratocystis pirilliformis]|uniref:NADP-dependent oxidoreductase domain-containing protein n=1 Tax=Ceratocystis pirilliformis TaxID=259994 RepID=A0ABR3Z236_9PEZI
MPLIAQNTKPRIILGLMTFGPSKEAGTRIADIEEYKKCLDTLQVRGYNEVDTARVYIAGQQEAFTREAGWKDRGLTLATKIQYPMKDGTNTAENGLSSAETSLKELGTDAYRAVPFAETLGAIDKLHTAGKFVRFGISNFTAFEVAEIVMTCKQNNWSADDLPDDGRLANTSSVIEVYRARYLQDTTFKAMKLVEEAASKHNPSLIEVSLCWTVHHSALKVLDGNDGVIVAASSKEQIEQNVTNLEKGPLPADVVEATEKAWELTRGNGAPYWHKRMEYGYDTKKAVFGSG